MNLKQQREAELKEARDIAQRVKDAGRSFTDDERTQIDGHLAKASELADQIKAAEADEARFKQLGDLGGDRPAPKSEPEPAAKTLGEHAATHMWSRLAEVKGVQGASVSAPEFKAATDTQVTPAGMGPALTQIDRTVVQGYRPRLVISDLLGSGTLSGNAISYFVEGALEGAFTTVAEGGAKPQLHVADPTTVTDTLKKIAGFVKLTDEMTEDLDFFVSEINNRLLYELARFEEAQLLNGNGTGSNVLGIMGRSGVQTLGVTTDLKTGNADQVFKAMTSVNTASGLDPDGIVINPTDYQNFRLMKDSNNQYYGGGFFQGEYGVNGIPQQPPLWGLRTVVTPAISAGTVLVGAFGQAATVYRKGGVRVESTNSHASDFTNNLVTVRAEERVALAVRRPSAFVKLTLGTA